MKSILKASGFASLAENEKEILGFIAHEAEKCMSTSDLLGAGEWHVSELDYCKEKNRADALLAKTIALWASSSELAFSPISLRDLATNLQYFSPEAVAASIIAITMRRSKGLASWSGLLTDLAFKTSSELKKLLQTKSESPTELVSYAATKMKTLAEQCSQALSVFSTAHCGSARTAAIEIIRSNRQIKPFLLAHERPILSLAEMMLAGEFREFCVAFERAQNENVMSHVNEIRKQAQEIAESVAYENSVIWQTFVKPAAKHLIFLADEATRSCRLAVTPMLKLSSNTFKVDFSRPEGKVAIVAQLTNSGPGAARKIELRCQKPHMIKISSPREAFDLSGTSDIVVVLEAAVTDLATTLHVPIEWHCADVTGHKHACDDIIRIEQQRIQPDWEVLLKEPPYPVNPIKARDRLFGREAQLSDLLLNSAGGNSTFVWGQKRVGKTSLLQVLNSELNKRGNVISTFFRMGELISMHEGQVAYAIATRLSDASVELREEQFGAGMGKLIPVVEKMTAKHPDRRFVVVIDEFDDLDPAFYTGERGRIFVKALRSLSEIGLTFLFAGSERMNVIYAKHSQELNKWTSMFLDSIASRQDCRDLITKPIESAIEYETACVDAIADYCQGNPFFMHLVCQALFKLCVAERRTFISAADFRNEQGVLSKTLGQSNFAHLWEDNQTLDREENVRFAAENCLILCCASRLRRYFASAEDLWEQLDSLNLTSTERLSLREMSMVVERLRARKVVTELPGSRKMHISLPILSDWLQKNAELSLLPIWRRFAAEKADRTEHVIPAIVPSVNIRNTAFPIPEDDLLPISQRLVFCGKQKDVAELRLWLRQFDDENRIEIAFLLLKRLAEKGYINAGEREFAISKLVETVNAMRLKFGAGKWTVVRGRKDDLCISYVDSELKSGANLAREVAKRLNPGKAGDAKEISNWIKSHLDADPMIVLVDDFAGTGATISKGFQKWRKDLDDDRSLKALLDQGRIAFAVLFGYGDSVDKLRDSESRLKIFQQTVFGSEVRAFDPEAQIFETLAERDFAKQVMIQVGRELTPQMPLGFGDQGGLIAFHNSVPNNTLPIFWSNGRVNERNWMPLFSRA